MRRMAAIAAVCVGLVQVGAVPPPRPDTVASHVAKATQAAGGEYTVLVKALCPGPIVNAAPIDMADRASWHAGPVRVFDNLYYVGQKTVSAWALKTSAGIIVIDALFDYSVEDEIWDGLRRAGLDPSTIRYVIVTHGHSDHLGGAAFLQKKGATIVMARADWPLAAAMEGDRPVRDRRFIAVTGRQRLTLGDTTVDMVPTPGHTPGTLSLTFPVRDGKAWHRASIWGGTGFNTRTPEQFSSYARSAHDFAQVTRQAGVDVPLSNHPIVDATFRKVDMLARRGAGDVHPFVTGERSQQALLTTAQECAKASLLAAGG